MLQQQSFMSTNSLDNKINSIIMINGSPRRERSNTQYIADYFLEGAREAGARTEVEYLYGKKMQYCQGEFHCFEKTPGKCMYDKKDEVQALWEKAVTFDLILIGSGVYASFLSGKTKTFLERVLPLLDPHLEKDGNPDYVDPSPPEGLFNQILGYLSPYVLPSIDPHFDPGAVGEYHHRARVDEKGNRFKFPPIGFICNAGLPEQSQFEVIKEYARDLPKNLRNECVVEIYRGQGELFTFKSLLFYPIFQKYQNVLRQAGREVVRQGRISKPTQAELEKPLIHHDWYMSLANAHFDRELGDFSSPLNRMILAHNEIQEFAETQFERLKGLKERHLPANKK